MEIFLSINKSDEMLLLCDTMKQPFMEREEENRVFHTPDMLTFRLDRKRSRCV